jgi:hypothetical protein
MRREVAKMELPGSYTGDLIKIRQICEVDPGAILDTRDFWMNAPELVRIWA